MGGKFFCHIFVAECLFLQYGHNGNQEPLQELRSPSSNYIRHVYTEAKEPFEELNGSGNRATQFLDNFLVAVASHCINEVVQETQ